MTPIDSLRSELRALTAEVRSIVSEKLPALLFGWTLTSKSSAMGAADEVQTADDDTNKGQRPVRRIEPFGLRSRTPSKMRALWLRLGASNVVFLGIAPSQGYGPSDLEDGEVAIYNVSKALQRFWKTGKITIDADSGQDIVLNGGTKKVARVTDPVRIGTLAGSTPVGGGAVTFVFTPVDADGTPGTPVTSVTANIAGIISNAGGAPNVKA